MVSCYIDRPDNVFRQGKFSILNSFCFAEFLRHYYIVSNNENKKNDYQPEQLTDKLVEFNHCMNSMSPKVMPSMNSSERLKYCKIPFVSLFHVLNRETHPEEYAHHLLFMYLPFRNEMNWNMVNPPSYAGKLAAPGVIDILNNKKSLVDPFTDIAENAFERYN